MASAESIIHNYGDVISPYNFELLGSALSYKQQKYDANREKIQNTINQVFGFDVDRPVDQDYLYSRATALLDDINRYSKADLSNSSITTALSGHISQAIDSNVLNAYAGTLQKKSYDKITDWYRKNRPEEYSTVNDAYGQESYARWMNDQNVGTRLGGMKYTPYIDLKKKQDDNIAEIYKATKGGKYQRRNNDGTITEIEMSGLSRSQVEGLVSSSWGPQEIQQAQINGWYSAKNNPAAMSNQTVNSLIRQKNSSYDNDIRVEKAKLAAGNLSQVDIDSINSNIQAIESQRSNYSNRVADFFGVEHNQLDSVLDPVSVGTFVNMQMVEDYAVNKYQKFAISETIKNDEAYWEEKNLQRNLIKDANDNSNTLLGLRIKAAAEGMSLDANGNLVAAASTATGGGGLLNTAGTFSTVKDDSLTTIELEEQRAKSFLDASVGYNNSVTQFVESLDKDDRYTLLAYANAHATPETASMSENERIFHAVRDLSGAQNTLLSNGKNSLSLYNAAANALDVKSRSEIAEVKLYKLDNELYDNIKGQLGNKAMDDNFPLALPDGSVVDAAAFYKSGRDYSKGVSRDDALLASVLSEKFINDFTESSGNLELNNLEGSILEKRSRSEVSGASHSVPMFKSNMYSSKGQNILTRIASELGEKNVKFDDVFDITSKGVVKFKENSVKAPLTLNMLRTTEFIKYNPNNETSRSYQKYSPLISDFTVDTRWLADRGISNMLEGDASYKALRQKTLEESLQNIERTGAWSVSTSDTRKPQQALAQTLLNFWNAANPDEEPLKASDAISLQAQYNPKDNTYVIKAGKDRKEAIIPEVDFTNAGVTLPEMGRWTTTADRFTEKKVRYSFPENQSNEDTRLYFKDMPGIPKEYLDKQTAKATILKDNTTSDLLMTTDLSGQRGLSPVASVLDNLLDNGHKYLSVLVKPYTNNGYSFFQYNLVYDNKSNRRDARNGEVIYSIPLETVHQYEAIQNRVNMAPQTIAAELYSGIFAEEQAAQKNMYGTVKYDKAETFAYQTLLSLNKNVIK